MGIASFSTTGLLGSFQGLVGWLTAIAPAQRAPRQAQVSRPTTAWAPSCTNHANPPAVWPVHPSCSALTPAAAARRPVRVLRVIDAPQSAANAGRMRISGRMADVCAELDRMAALEAVPRSGALRQ